MSEKQTNWYVLAGILTPFLFFVLTLASLTSKTVAAYFIGSLCVMGIIGFVYQINIMGWHNFLRYLTNQNKMR